MCMAGPIYVGWYNIIVHGLIVVEEVYDIYDLHLSESMYWPSDSSRAMHNIGIVLPHLFDSIYTSQGGVWWEPSHPQQREVSVHKCAQVCTLLGHALGYSWK